MRRASVRSSRGKHVGNSSFSQMSLARTSSTPSGEQLYPALAPVNAANSAAESRNSLTRCSRSGLGSQTPLLAVAHRNSVTPRSWAMIIAGRLAAAKPGAGYATGRDRRRRRAPRRTRGPPTRGSPRSPSPPGAYRREPGWRRSRRRSKRGRSSIPTLGGATGRLVKETVTLRAMV